MADDPELRLDRDRTDLHSLRAADPELDGLSARIQRTAAAAAAASLRRDDAARVATLAGQRILVTGSAGYVGAALCHALSELGAEAVGLDVVAGETVHIEANTADAEAVRAAVAGCSGVLHTAARHAPHATHHHESEFIATNVTGTQNILDAAAAEAGAGGIPVVQTSTTSLTITKRVKSAEKAGQLVWLDATAQPAVPATAADDPADAPRNKYGRTKLEAERRCVAAAEAGLPCVVVRISRCFPEDVLPDSVTEAAAALSSPNLKANELLGRRLALVDVLTGHLRALTRAREPSLKGRVLTLSAPFPFAREDTPTETAGFLSFLQAQRPELSDLYGKLGWSLPDDLGRVYDSSLAVELLEWRPAVTFDQLVAALAGGEAGEEAGGMSAEDARAGCY
jgi:nucleoside-diphosphate-sugar epimerase